MLPLYFSWVLRQSLISSYQLSQRCPTLSPIATCGDKHNFFDFVFIEVSKKPYLLPKNEKAKEYK